MSNKIELKTISELQGMNFFIPSYQRGYRWTRQQVKDLLNDIHEFKDEKGFYCIQPLVVKSTVKESDLLKLIKKTEKLDEIRNLLGGYWEVIDGQQRLTTISILLSFLKMENWYAIEYETRPKSRSFLKNIRNSLNQSEENIDFFHIIEAWNQIDEWFAGKEDEVQKQFAEKLLNKVKFIWYESVDEDPIQVFTRLNIGKISLTNAELIKALFLNKSNFKNTEYSKIRLQQQEIANEWDTIEFTLQSDEFWLFLNQINYNKPTRIDLIFDLVYRMNILQLQDGEFINLGNDEYKTFRYFYTWFKKQNENNFIECWKQAKNLFQIFQEWFNDLELYHYIGYLIELGINISYILEGWNRSITKDNFISNFIIPEIKKNLPESSGFNKKYGGSSKTQCRPILLLHNIQTVINQNKSIKESEKYNLPVFYKFPFHLFKKEKWDVEHIDSYTENSLDDRNSQKEWLKASYIGIDNDKTREKIVKFLSAEKQEKTEFDVLYKEIMASSKDNKLSDQDKDKLWNFTLLDYSTNRSYGNSIFPAKRRIIIGKDQGKNITLNDNLNVDETNGAIAFIPPCTRNVFLKYFNTSTNNPREWDRKDAEAYMDNIQTTLADFLK